MSASDLLAQLRATFPAGATSGTFNAAGVLGGEYVALLTGLGIPATIALTSETGWQQLGDDIVFAGAATTPLLAVPAAAVHFQFSPSGSDFVLLLDVQLPATWTLAQSFKPLSTPALDGLVLDPAQRSALIVTSGPATDPWQTDNGDPVQVTAAGLTFAGWFATNSSVVTQLAALLGGGTHAMVTGPVGWDAAKGVATLSLPLWTGSTTLLGSSTLNMDLAVYGGFDASLPNQYRAGIRFDTKLAIAVTGQSAPQTVELSALLVTFDQGVIDLMLSGSAFAFPTPAALASLFGAGNGIATALPGQFQGGNLVQVDSVLFGIGLTSHTLEYAMLTVGIAENQTWQVWPGVLEFDGARFSFMVTAPLDPARTTYAFTATAWFGTLGIPLVAKALLPAKIFTVALDPAKPAPSLGPLLQKVFGFNNGLPQELLITQVSLSADISQSVYDATVEIEGDWSFDVGVDNQVTFEDLRLEFGYSADDGPSGEIAARFAIGDSDFAVRCEVSRTKTVLHGEWTAQGAPLTYLDIAIALGLWGLPNTPQGLDLALTGASFDFDFSAMVFDFTVATAKYGSAALIAGKDAAGNWGFVFGMLPGVTVTLDLSTIDVIGSLVPRGDDILALSILRLVAATTALPAYQPPPDVQQIIGPVINSGLVLSAELKAGTAIDEPLTVRFGGANDGTATDTPPPPPGQAALVRPAASDPSASPAPQATWLDIQRSFGPVQFQRIGFAITPDDELALLLDAAVSLAGLSIGLTGLQASMPIRAPYTPSFDLAGLAVRFSGGGVSIAGGLAKVPGMTPVEYTGELSVQIARFGVTALGSYTTVNGQPSLFAFLYLDAPLGGPAFFFVTGLAGGFGYNRSLRLPDISGVQQYPLVAGAMGTIDATTTQTQLNAFIQPAQNENWLAAGVRFTSFEMVRSFALLTVAFGTHVEIALLGESVISVPVPAQGETIKPVAQAVMAVLVDISPSSGQLAVCAQLTPESYILDQAAHLTGGFAFYAWFGPSHQAGDFVVTLGGYNPYFTPPAHYPRQVPRLGLNWKLSAELSVSGGLYFALTPSVLMAGGYLKATWQSGDISAWFDAQADFLIRFKPFQYLIDVSITIGVSFTLNLLVTTKRVTLHTGVALVLWGPPFGGQATVDLAIISFTISFGQPQPKPLPDLDWAKFRQSFLPPANKSERGGGQRGPLTAEITGAAPPPTPTDSLVTISAAAGLTGTVTDGDVTVWVVTPAALRIMVATQAPSTSASVITAKTMTPSGQWTSQLGVGPMGAGAGSLSSVLTIAIDRDGAPDTDTWAAAAATGGVPKGLYQNTANTMQADGMVTDALLGVTLTPAPPAGGSTVPVAVAELLAGDPAVTGFSWSAVAPPDHDDYDQRIAMATLQSTLNDSAVGQVRAGLLGALRDQGLSVAASVDVAGFAAAAPTVLASAPQLRLLGEEVSG